MTADSSDRRNRRRERSDARRNRAAVVAAAVQQLRDDGTIDMQRVAAAAGVSRSTLHRHFGTRAKLEAALRDESLREAQRLAYATVSERRPPLAMLRRLVEALVAVGAERRLDVLGALPLGDRADVVAGAVAPAVERTVEAAELSPPPPEALVLVAARHAVETCLERGAGSPHQPQAAADEIFRALTEPLDQALVVLDAEGALVCLNAAAAQALDPNRRVAVGERLTMSEVELLYEDGSPCPPTAHPLAAALETHERQGGVRGHRLPTGQVAWAQVDARPLRAPGEQAVYAVLAVLSDVSEQRDWELRRLRPPGQLVAERQVPLDIARVLDEIPPHLFPEQFVSEARRVAGGPVALYVLDIDGTYLLRLAGAEEFPDRLEAPLALGPELADDGVGELRARVESELPGVVMVPMWVRGRAIGVMLALGAAEEPLVELGRHGAAALELARGYTDVIDAARRRKETHAAAELQQSLLPPRIARIGGGELAGSVLPSYEVGGDWFDYVENRDGAWIAIADAAGKGATAGAMGSIALAALRAARRDDQSIEEAARAMHEVTYDVGRPEFFVTAIVARWHAVHAVFSWINCGHPPPLVLRPDDTIEQLLRTPAGLPLGLWERERRFTRTQRRLEPGERLILHSDGITARRTSDGLFGLDGIERAVRGAADRSAAAIAKAIQEAVMSASEDPLQDDAVAIVLAPTA